jgi:DMSO reductase anchor subunit
MILSLIISLLHPGIPAKAYRVIANLRTSWLSREIFFALLFTGVLLVMPFLADLNMHGSSGQIIYYGCAGLAGLAMVYSMARIYMLRTVPSWLSGTVPISFLLTSLVSGYFLVTMLSSWRPAIPPESTINLLIIPAFILYPGLWIVRLWQNRMWNFHDKQKYISLLRRALVTLTGTFSIVMLPALNLVSAGWFRLLVTSAFILVITSEIIERYMFYRSYDRQGF